MLESAGLPLKPYIKVSNEILMLQNDTRSIRTDVLDKLKADRAELELDLTKWVADSAAAKQEVESVR